MRFLDRLHRQVPVYSLCLYRAGLGFLIFAESVQWSFHSREMLSNEGFHIPHLAWLPVPSPLLALVLALALVLSSLMLCLGLFTRLAILLTQIFWCYIYALDSTNEKAAQTIVMVVLCFLFFSACGNRFSLDNYFRRKRGQPEYPELSSAFVLNMLRFEFVNIYFFCGLAKMTYPEWVSGTTFARVLNGRWATPLGLYIASLKPDMIARIGGLGTILFELSQGFLLLMPATRYYAILLGIGFHAGIQATLYIGTLGLHFILALVCLFPAPEDVAKIVAKFAEGDSALSIARAFARDKFRAS